MNKKDQWMEDLVKKYRIPAETESKPPKILTEQQLKIIKNGKDKK
jgi:hypothetical protein